MKYKIDEDNRLKVLEKLENKEVYLFAMSGKMGSGKDTIGELVSKGLNAEIVNTSFGFLIRDEIEKTIEGFNKTSEKKKFAEEVKVSLDDLEMISLALTNTTVYERTDEARFALQYWGTEIRRNQYNNYWIDKMANFIVDTLSKGKSVNVTDARFPNEVDLVKDLGGKIVRLELSDEVRLQRLTSRDNNPINLQRFNHVSEIALDSYKFDKVFNAELPIEEIVQDSLNYINQ